MKNPGKPMTIYDVAENLGEAFPGVSGIYPMDHNIFKDDEFLPAFVTNRPEPVDEQPNVTGINVAPAENEAIPTPVSLVDTPQPVEVNYVLLVCKEATPIESTQVVYDPSPAHRQTEPWLGPIFNTVRGDGKALILRDTPVKDRLVE